MSSLQAPFDEEELARLYSILRSELIHLPKGLLIEAVSAAGFNTPELTINPEYSYGNIPRLLEDVDRLFREMAPHAKLPALTVLAEKLIKKHDDLSDVVQNFLGNIQELLGKHGYQFENGTFVPVGILDARERQYLPSSAASNLEKAMDRLGNGDYTGAITSACGAVDTVTAAIYRQKHLGDPGKEGFKAKVDRVLNELNVFREMETELVAQGLQASDANRVVDNMRRATQSAAEVLQIFRRNPGDAHGSQLATRQTAYDAIKWASAICGLLEGKI